MTAQMTGPGRQGHQRPGWTSSSPSTPSRARTVVGSFFLFTAGVHVGIVGADPSTYESFADEALLGLVRDGWREVFMAAPVTWGLLLALGEAALGLLLLLPRTARAGWAGVLLFHLALMLFGLGFWLYAVPATAVLAVLASRDLRRGEAGGGGPTPARPPS